MVLTVQLLWHAMAHVAVLPATRRLLANVSFGAAAVKQLIKADVLPLLDQLVLALAAPRDSHDDEYTHYMAHSDSELHEHWDQHFDTPGCCCRS